ncbi:hypothetical protein GCM10022243_03230 [Saccharothrix violaceirubra]
MTNALANNTLPAYWSTSAFMARTSPVRARRTVIESFTSDNVTPAPDTRPTGGAERERIDSVRGGGYTNRAVYPASAHDA